MKLRKFFEDGGGSDRLSLSYYSADVEANWAIDIEGPDSLQIVYTRGNLPETYKPDLGRATANPDEKFWLYLSPQDAAVLGGILTAYAAANGEAA